MNSYTLLLISDLIVKISLSALPLLMKVGDDNLAVKTDIGSRTLTSCSATKQPPVDSVKVQNNVSVLLTKKCGHQDRHHTY
jgi:hypothetical protein